MDIFSWQILFVYVRTLYSEKPNQKNERDHHDEGRPVQYSNASMLYSSECMQIDLKNDAAPPLKNEGTRDNL